MTGYGTGQGRNAAQERRRAAEGYDGLSTSLIANGGRALESKSWQRIFANCAHKPGGPKYRLGQ